MAAYVDREGAKARSAPAIGSGRVHGSAAVAINCRWECTPATPILGPIAKGAHRGVPFGCPIPDTLSPARQRSSEERRHATMAGGFEPRALRPLARANRVVSIYRLNNSAQT